MNQTKLNSIPYLLITLLVWFSMQYLGNAQKPVPDQRPVTTDYPYVEWVRNWPSADSKPQKKKFKDQFNSVLFGNKAPVLSNPVALMAYSPDEFWILDQANKTVFQVKKGVGDIPHSISKSDLDLSSLVGICFGPNSSILFTDSKAQKVFRILPEKKKLDVLNDTLSLEQPTGIAYSSVNKEIWVVESKAHRISILNENGGLIKRIGHRGNAEGEFNYPTHIWIDKNGYIYINDALNFRIQVLNPDGKVISVFGQAGDASGYLARPKGIAADSFGNIYIVDALFHVVQVFDIKGNFLYTFGSQGHGNGEFWMPSGIFIDSLDNIYVADTYNSRIQLFKLIYAESK
jgi:DNA-binding beta-propeller fold protein YncE